MSLKAFLKQSAILPENKKIVVSKRFVGDSGKPIEWEVRAITSAEDEKIRTACTKREPIPGKRNQYTEKTDQAAYIRSLAAACTVFPNLNDKELQDSYGVMSAEQLIGEMLLPGEFAEYINRIGELTGFDVTMEERVEEAKN